MSEPLLRKAGLLDDESGLHLLSLSVLLTDAMGPTFLAWDYDALRAELQDRWGTIGPVTWERIMALTVLHAHDAAWREWEVFENMVAAVLGEMPIFSYVQPPEPEEMAIALYTFGRIDNTRELSTEVKDYIVAAALFDGLWYFKGTLLEPVQSSLDAYDHNHSYVREYAEVDKALRARSTFYADPDSVGEVQANRVREVNLALERYTTAVNTQLRGLPKLLRRH